MREVQFIKNFTIHAEGSVLVNFGHTKVLCNATIENKVPPFLRGQNTGWIRAEYSMLPRSTEKRNNRDMYGRVNGRSIEISRLIARSLRASVDLTKLVNKTIIIDCDVIQADGGTRTAAICGGFVAMNLAFNKLIANKVLEENPIKEMIAAVSVGIVNDEIISDLDYNNDSNASVDMNLVMTKNLDLVEIQGTAEKNIFSQNMLQKMIKAVEEDILLIIKKMEEIICK